MRHCLHTQLVRLINDSFHHLLFQVIARIRKGMSRAIISRSVIDHLNAVNSPFYQEPHSFACDFGIIGRYGHVLQTPSLPLTY